MPTIDMSAADSFAQLLLNWFTPGGCVTHMEAIAVDPPAIYAVNARMMAGLDPASVSVRQIDNGHSSFLDEIERAADRRPPSADATAGPGRLALSKRRLDGFGDRVSTPLAALRWPRSALTESPQHITKGRRCFEPRDGSAGARRCCAAPRCSARSPA
jgi:hypothetical protein